MNDNDKIDGLGTISSPICRLVNVMDIFKLVPDGCRHSHDYRNFVSHILYDVSLPFIKKLLGVYDA